MLSVFSPGVPAPSPGDTKCELVGTFSLITQAFLGILCLSLLLFKRYCEYPMERSWPVWLFDVLKQITGAFGVHVFNVFLSVLKGQDALAGRRGRWLLAGPSDDSPDPCDWYFLSILLDCTIGVYILYLVFRFSTHVCKRHLGITQIDSGEYGPDPRKPSVTAFLKQLLVYFASLMATKIILYLLVESFEKPLLWFTSNVLLRWLDEFPNEIEIFLIMFVFPIFLNCLQLVLIDNFIQNQAMLRFNKRALHMADDSDDSTPISTGPGARLKAENEQAGEQAGERSLLKGVAHLSYGSDNSTGHPV